MNCPYCVRSVSNVDAAVVYQILGYGRLWLCDVCDGLRLRYPVCDAYVGAHFQSNVPTGTRLLDNSDIGGEMPMLVFDPIWKSGNMTRNEAPMWLCKQMGIPKEKAHIAMFDEQQCKQVVKLCLNRSDQVETGD